MAMALVGTPDHEVLQQKAVVLRRQRVVAMDTKYGFVLRFAGFRFWNSHKLVEGSAFGTAKIARWASGHVATIGPFQLN
jgi:hypothetical protein